MPSWVRAAFSVVAVISVYVLFWPRPAGSGIDLPGADKAVHLLLFLLLAGTARLRFGAVRLVLAGLLAYAAVSELVQALLLSGRSGDLLDLLADALGVVGGWLLAGRRPAHRG